MREDNDKKIAPMLNAYPDSMGGTLSDIVALLSQNELKDVFGSFYILPSIFHTDLDRGFSVIDYGLNELLAKKEDLERLQQLSIDLKLDFILNHSSVLSKQFQDILKNGKSSKYKDFFIDWNHFWAGKGSMTQDGFIQPDEKYIKDMFFRKPGLPILMVRLPDGNEVPYWNTFYQEVRYPRMEEQELMQELNIQYGMAKELSDIINQEITLGKTPKEINLQRYQYLRPQVSELLESKRKYLGQMDLNIKSPLVWEYYEEVFQRLSEYGAKIVRLDAFAYAPKEPGEKNFLNDPGTWELLEKVRRLADRYGLALLPEIHSSYEDKTYELLAKKGYMTYDFFLPGLIIDALENENGGRLKEWAEELIDKNIKVVNMLGCHDGIPLLDLKGLIPETRIEALIDTIVERGGYVKNLHGQKNVYYQVNATYYSALGEDDRKMLLARALQIFMPGLPQVWYLDLLAGKNDHKAVELAGAGGHKEINRTNLASDDINARLKLPLVQKQIEMLRFRNQFFAFALDSKITVTTYASEIFIKWEKDNSSAVLIADLSQFSFEMKGFDNLGNIEFLMKQ